MVRPFALLALSVAIVSMNSVIRPHSISGQQPYRLPPPEVVEIIDAPPVPRVRISPDRNWILFVERDAMPGIEAVSRRKLRLAGMRIDPAANGPFLSSYDRGLSLRSRDGGTVTRVALPDDALIASTSWSHRSDCLAVTTVTAAGQQLWLVKVTDPHNPVLLTDRLSTVMNGIDWSPDGQSILCLTVPEDRGDEPAAPQVPAGPNVQESAGNKSPTRTYQDLLTSPHDEALFEYYARNRLTVLGVDGSTSFLGEPAMISSASYSPSGRHLLVHVVHRPFSYLMTWGSFPHRIEVWDRNGQVVHQVADVPMAENIPIEGVRTGPRSVRWKAGDPDSLLWLEALDGGDPNKPAEFRDRFMRLDAPFDQPPQELLRTEFRGVNLTVMADPSMIVVSEYDRDRRWMRNRLHNLAKPDQAPQTLMDRSIRDHYGDPGSIVTERDETGFSRALQNGDWVYRFGQGASPKGNLPFVDRQNLVTLETERLWRCAERTYESPLAIVESGGGKLPVIITSHETRTTPPNYRMRDLASGEITALTDFADPTPQIRGIKKQLVKYQRADGVDLSATLYLPAGYQEGERLPLLVWAYPREFNDPDTAGQIAGSPNQFVRMAGSTHLTFLTQGYAIMDSATMPVIGDPETMNDTFIEQIVSSAAAAIDKAVEMGVADRNRVGVGGHSYGAFMTANLLAHCDLFRAGIARSGAYNRTLTPFGFQSERRPFWEAKDIYFNISPFMHAAKIQEPLLLIHGEVDNNSGTFPMQSQRMYQAVKGNGGTVRLVMLPNESHGYRARESVLHTQAEMIEWFDRFVKNAEPVEATSGAVDDTVPAPEND